MCAKKTGKIYYSMGEVTEMFDVNPSLVRFWESKFDILKPHKNKKGNRLFTPADIENLKLIYHLVKEKGMTLEGARKQIKANREGINRDLEIVDRLLGIKALLAEIKQELGVGADFANESEFEQEPETKAEVREIVEESTVEVEYRPTVEEYETAPEEEFTIDITDGQFPDTMPADDFDTGQVQQIVSQNIVEIAGEELPEEYIGELSGEIAEEAAIAAEVREALAELEKSQEKPQGPAVFEQTLF